MTTRLRKGLTGIAASVALATGCLLFAVPASAVSVNKTESLPYAYDKAGKVVYGKIHFAYNKERPQSRYVYKLTLSTTSTVKQTAYWHVYCGTTEAIGRFDVFTGNSSVSIDETITCSSGRPLTVTYSTTEGAKSELVLFP